MDELVLIELFAAHAVRAFSFASVTFGATATAKKCAEAVDSVRLVKPPTHGTSGRLRGELTIAIATVPCANAIATPVA